MIHQWIWSQQSMFASLEFAKLANPLVDLNQQSMPKIVATAVIYNMQFFVLYLVKRFLAANEDSQMCHLLVLKGIAIPSEFELLLLKTKSLIKNDLATPCFVFLDTVLEKQLLFNSSGTRKHFQELFLQEKWAKRLYVYQRCVRFLDMKIRFQEVAIRRCSAKQVFLQLTLNETKYMKFPETHQR